MVGPRASRTPAASVVSIRMLMHGGSWAKQCTQSPLNRHASACGLFGARHPVNEGGSLIPAKETAKTLLKTLGPLADVRHTTSAMNTYPRICHEVGLDCETCTEGTARHLAKVCRGLRGKMIGQMFVQ